MPKNHILYPELIQMMHIAMDKVVHLNVQEQLKPRVTKGIIHQLHCKYFINPLKNKIANLCALPTNGHCNILYIKISYQS